MKSDDVNRMVEVMTANRLRERTRQLAEQAGFVVWEGAIDWASNYDDELEQFAELIRADERQAIEQAEKQEPVVWLDNGLGVFYWASEFNDRPVPPGFEPLYAAQPRTWSDVTDDALIEEVRHRGFAIRDAQISAKQKPVAWVVFDHKNNDIVWTEEGKKLKPETPLYTTPVMDDDIYDVWVEQGEKNGG